MKKSTILIAIPTYNCKDVVLKTVNSALNQKLPANILIVDNCSTDGTYNLLEKTYSDHSLVTLVRNSYNIGRVGNWNRLLEIFNEREESYIKFLFSGEELFPDCISECESVISKNLEVGAIIFPYEFYIEGMRPHVHRLNYNGLIKNSEVRRLNLVEGGFLGSIIGNVYNKKFIKNKFSEYFIGKNDFDFSVLEYSDAYYIPTVLARSNIHSRKTFFDALDYWSECEFVFNRAYWLEKNKSLISLQYYKSARINIFTDFVFRMRDYYTGLDYLNIIIIANKVLFIKLYMNIKKLIKHSWGNLKNVI